MYQSKTETTQQKQSFYANQEADPIYNPLIPGRKAVVVHDAEVRKQIENAASYFDKLEIAMNAIESGKAAYHFNTLSFSNEVDIITLASGALSYTVLANFENPRMCQEFDENFSPIHFLIEYNANEFGALELFTADESQKRSLAESVYFGQGIANLEKDIEGKPTWIDSQTENLDGSLEMLDKFASDYLRTYREGSYSLIRLIGRASEEGAEVDNEILSLGRAIAVKDYLVSKGIFQDLIEVEGHGETDPIEWTDQSWEGGKARNRMVEIQLIPYVVKKREPEEDDTISEICMLWSIDDFDVYLDYFRSDDEGFMYLTFYLKENKMGYPRGTCIGSALKLKGYNLNVMADKFAPNHPEFANELREAGENRNGLVKVPEECLTGNGYEELRDDGFFSVNMKHNLPGDGDFQDSSFVTFWSQLLQFGYHRLKFEGEYTSDYLYWNIRAIIASSGILRNELFTSWISLEDCKSDYNRVTENEEKIQKLLMKGGGKATSPGLPPVNPPLPFAEDVITNRRVRSRNPNPYRN